MSFLTSITSRFIKKEAGEAEKKLGKKGFLKKFLDSQKKKERHDSLANTKTRVSGRTGVFHRARREEEEARKVIPKPVLHHRKPKPGKRSHTGDPLVDLGRDVVMGVESIISEVKSQEKVLEDDFRDMDKEVSDSLKALERRLRERVNDGREKTPEERTSSSASTNDRGPKKDDSGTSWVGGILEGLGLSGLWKVMKKLGKGLLKKAPMMVEGAEAGTGGGVIGVVIGAVAGAIVGDMIEKMFSHDPSKADIYPKIPNPIDDVRGLWETLFGKNSGKITFKAKKITFDGDVQGQFVTSSGTSSSEGNVPATRPSTWSYSGSQFGPPGSHRIGERTGAPPGQSEDEQGLVTRVEGMTPTELARTKLGEGEVPDREDLMQYLKNGGVNLDPTKKARCAAFVNSTLRQTGYKGTGSDMSLSFKDYGTDAMKDPQKGDIAVFSRGAPGSGMGHVGFFEGYNKDHSMIKLLAGNAGRNGQVKEEWVSVKRLVAIRRAVKEADEKEGRVKEGRLEPSAPSPVQISAPPAVSQVLKAPPPDSPRWGGLGPIIVPPTPKPKPAPKQDRLSSGRGDRLQQAPKAPPPDSPRWGEATGNKKAPAPSADKVNQLRWGGLPPIVDEKTKRLFSTYFGVDNKDN